jgi:S1-C subfamily serine protease
VWLVLPLRRGRRVAAALEIRHFELPPQEFYSQGEGSGFVWDDEGHIVTNYHVVQNAEKVDVTFLDGTSLPAAVVGTDPDSDLAVLEVDLPPDQPRPVALGDSDAVFVSQRAIAIGNPFGREWTLTTGMSVLGGARCHLEPANSVSRR